MNTELANRLISALRTPQPEQPEFNMAWFISDSHGESVLWHPVKPGCGTTCCIAGTTAWLAGIKPGDYIREFAEEALELTDDEAEWLFYGEFHSESMLSITRDQAIQAIQFLLDDGTVRVRTPNGIYWKILFQVTES